MRANSIELWPVDAVTRGLAIRPIIDKTSLHEDFEVLRNRRLSKVELADNILAATGLLHHQLANDTDADRMTKRGANARCRLVVNAELREIWRSFGRRFVLNYLHRKSTIYDYALKFKIWRCLFRKRPPEQKQLS